MADMKEMIEILSDKEISEISKIMGVDIQTAYKLKTEFIENNAIPVSSFISDASKDAYSQLGISMNTNMNMELKDGLVASLAALIQATIINSEYVDHNTAQSEKDAVSRQADDAKALPGSNKAHKDSVNQWAKERYSEINEKYNFSGFAGAKNLAMYVLNVEAFNKVDGEKTRLNGYKEAFAVVNKLKYLNVSENRLVPTLEPVVHTAQTIKNKTYNVNPDIEKFVIAQNNVPWRYKVDFDETYEAWMKTKAQEGDTKAQKEEKEALKEQILVSLGKEPIDTNKHHVSEIKKIMSNNDKIERDMGTLASMYEAFKGKDMYLPWAEIANGRAAIQSDMNPQESKLIRSFIEQPTQNGSQYPGHTTYMNIHDFAKGTDTIEMLEMAISQAFDMDPDKNSKRTVLRSIRNVVDITGSDVLINDETDLGKALITIVTGSDEKTIAEAYNVVFNEGEGHHGLQAARMLKRLVAWKGESDEYRKKNPFRNDLTIETDAITSGMILTLMQIVDDASIELLAKGGIYTQGTMDTWSDYTDKWLRMKYSMEEGAEYNEKIAFGPAGLIEAGNFHQTLKEGGDVEFDGEKISSAEAMKKYKALGMESGRAKKEKIASDVYTTEVFQDMYKTIGLEMQDAINTKKEEIAYRTSFLFTEREKLEAIDYKQRKEYQKAQLTAMNREYDRLKIQETMLNQIGNINPKVLRLIAKDPVMTYIYGSTISSIRKNLGGTVGVKNFVEAIKMQYKLKSMEREGKTLDEKDQAKLDIASAFIDATMASIDRRTSVTRGKDREGKTYPFDMKRNMTFKTLDGENRIVPVDNKKIQESGMTDDQALMLMNVDDNVVGVLTKAVNDTFGDAIEDAFEAKTQSVDAYRDIMKSIELITFEIFRARAENMKKDIMEKNDGVITQQAWDKMMKVLEESGYGHDAATGDNETTDRRIPLVSMETGSGGKQGTATIKFNREDIMNEDGTMKDANTNVQSRTYAYLTGRDFASNTGAAPTIIVHQMDSRAITLTIDENSWLSIYDAVVQASHPNNVKQSTDGYNKIVFDQNSVRDFVGDNIRKMNDMFAILNQRIKDGDKDAQDEMEQIVSRLRSTEKITYTLKTFETRKKGTSKKGEAYDFVSKEGVRIPKIDINNDEHIGTFSLTEKNNVTYFVDVLEKTYSDGTKIIKEVYWDNPKTGKLIGRTVVKTIKDDVMDVVVIIRHDITSLKDLGKDDRKTNTAYEMRYTITGSEEIKAHNKIYKKGAKLPDADMFDEIESETIERDIQGRNQELINIIETDNIQTNPSENVQNVGALKVSKGEVYVPTLAGQDFKNESQRLFLPLEAIMSNFLGAKKFSETRFKNLKKHKWFIGHAAISNTVPVSVGNGTGSVGNMDVKNVVAMLRKVRNGNVKTNHAYVEQFIDGFEGKRLPKNAAETMKLMKGGMDLSKASGSEPYVIGGDKTFGGGKLLDDIGLHNAGYYTKDSVVTILPAAKGKQSVEYNNGLGYGFESLKKAVKVGSTTVTENADAYVTGVMVKAGKFGVTDKDVIYVELKKNPAFKGELYQSDAELERQISSYQINAYMHMMNYTNEKKDGYNVWTTEFVKMTKDGKKVELPMNQAKKEIAKTVKGKC